MVRRQPANTQVDATSDPELDKALASLSAEDRELARKQRVCPVSKAALGSMGTPVKVRVRDRDVFICCNGCEKELQANAEKYLAQLPK